MNRPDNFFTALAGVPVHYDRLADAPYGTRGKPYMFYVMEAFQGKLEACFQELWEVCPYGRAEVITSAGAYVEKPGYHGKGRAFDLDGIFWSEMTLITRHYPVQRMLYLGVEAILRKHFGTVLNYLYDPAHRDHFHIDDGTPVKFTESSTSRNLFVQAAMTHVFDVPVLIDGELGEETKQAIKETFKMIGIPGQIRHKNAWRSFLTETAKIAFAQVKLSEKNPRELLRDLYRVIGDELRDSSSRKMLETALTTLVDHEETQQWLKNYR